MLDGRLVRLLILAMLTSLAIACGDSDDDDAPPSDAGSDSGPPATPPPVTTTDSGTPPPVVTEVECGSVTCMAPDFSNVMTGVDAGAVDPTALPIDPSTFASMGLTPCCTEDGADNPCGVESATLFPGGGCVEQDMPGVPDESCPSFPFSFSLTMPLPLTVPGNFTGCCTPEGKCGIDFSTVNVSLEQFASFLPGLGDIELNLGVGCMELTEANELGGDMVQITVDGGVPDGGIEAIACGADDGGVDDGG